MAVLYFLGGEDIKKTEAPDINKRAFEDAGGAPSILVFPWTARNEQKEYRKIMVDYFLELGAKKMVFASISEAPSVTKRKIESAHLIYFPGGKPRFLVERIKKRKLASVLRKYEGVIVGNSAGAVSMCEQYAVIKGQVKRPRTTMRPGIGLVDFAVSVHYKSANEDVSGIAPERELRALSRKTERKIFAIPERCALVLDEGKMRFIGKAYLFHMGEMKECG